MWSQVDVDYFEQFYFENALQYHNWDHIKNMFNYLDETQFPYDLNLAIAIAGHDCVYDNRPGKEFRSAILTAQVCEDTLLRFGAEVDVIKVCQLIMATERHLSDRYSDSVSAIVRADLHQLQYSKHKHQIEINFINILDENIKLYPDTKEIDICKSGKEFILQLISRVRSNVELDPRYKDFWIDVIDGLFYTIKLYDKRLVEIEK